jgi:hypothetical protein
MTWRAKRGRGRAWTVAAALCVGTLAVPMAPVAAVEGLIYVSAWQDASFASFGGDLRAQLAAQFSYDLGRVDNDIDVMRNVRADPRNIGFVQRDLFVARLQQQPSDFDRLEFYGDIAACLVVITRRGSPLQTYDQLVAARRDRKVTIDVGAAGGRVATTFAMLSALDPELGNLQLEFRGGARALSRVAAGDTDAAVLLAYAPFHSPDLDRLIDDEAVDLVPFFSRRVVAAAVQQRAPYTLREIELGTSGWFKSARRYQTTCSALGVVVNEQADARLSEAVAQAMLHGTSDFGTNGFMSNVREAVSGFIARVLSVAADLGQLAVTLVAGQLDAGGQEEGRRPYDIRLDETPARRSGSL